MTVQTITVTCRRQQPVIYTLTLEAEAPSGAGIAPHSEVCIGKPPGGVEAVFPSECGASTWRGGRTVLEYSRPDAARNR